MCACKQWVSDSGYPLKSWNLIEYMCSDERPENAYIIFISLAVHRTLTNIVILYYMSFVASKIVPVLLLLRIYPHYIFLCFANAIFVANGIFSEQYLLTKNCLIEYLVILLTPNREY